MNINLKEKFNSIVNKKNIPLLTICIPLLIGFFLMISRLFSYIAIKAKFDYYNININFYDGVNDNLLMELFISTATSIYIIIIISSMTFLWKNIKFIFREKGFIKAFSLYMLFILFTLGVNFFIPTNQDVIIHSISLFVVEMIVSIALAIFKKKKMEKEKFIDLEHFNLGTLIFTAFMIITSIGSLYLSNKLGEVSKKDFYIVNQKYVVLYSNPEKSIVAKCVINNKDLVIDSNHQTILSVGNRDYEYIKFDKVIIKK